MAFDLFEGVTAQLNRTDRDVFQDMPEIPQAVRLFLGQISLLQGIPLHYLIPDEKFIPKTTVTTSVSGDETEIEKGSIRLFMLDKEWIECLLDGALSIGNVSDREILLAKAMAGNYAAEVFYTDTKEKIKKQLYGLYTPSDYETILNQKLADKHIQLFDNGQPKPTESQNNWRYSGFIMRSAIIAQWVGVQVVAAGRGSDENGNKLETITPLQVVRFERLAPDTIFCICEGIITNIEITQPAETIHFGVSEDSSGKYKVQNNPIPFKNTAGVIDIEALQGLLPGRASGKLPFNDSANFANNMLSKPLKVKMNFNWSVEGQQL
ncbi:MAG: hypothetical protein ACO1OF_18010 [Adhaeribacter sp.]